MAITRDDVLRALQSVTIDAAGTTLPASGRLSQVVVDPTNRVMFSILIDASEAARFEPIRRAAEGKVLSVPGVSGVFASLTSERGPGMPEQSKAAPIPVAATPPRPGAPPGQGPALPGVRHIVAVASGKGGVGKSTTACNLALALKAQGLKVGLLDADIYGPSVPKLFGLSGKPKVVDNRSMEPMEGYGLKVMSIGFLIEPETAMIWRGPMVQSALTQMLRDVLWGELDVLIVDMPPGTGDAQLTMAQATPLSGAVIVSTPQDLALIDARRGVTMFKKVAVPILGVIENMATFICPNCNHESHIFGHGGARHRGAAPRRAVPRRNTAEHDDPRVVRRRAAGRRGRARRPAGCGLPGDRRQALGESERRVGRPGGAEDRVRIRLVMPPVLGLILAGGLARRMGGGDKVLRTLGGRTLLDRVTERLAPQCAAGIMLSANGDPRRFAGFPGPVLLDGVPDHPGPLAGILAGMDHIAAFHPDIAAMVSVSGDAPFLPHDLVTRLLQGRGGGRIVVAGSGERAHYTVALWPVDLRCDLRLALIERGERRVGAFIGRHGAEVIRWPADPVDPFLNVNTPDDLRAAEALLDGAAARAER